MTRAETLLVEAESNLKWAAEGEFSARVTPAQAQVLIKELMRLRTRKEDSILESRATFDREADLAIHHSAIGAPPDYGRSSA